MHDVAIFFLKPRRCAKYFWKKHYRTDREKEWKTKSNFSFSSMSGEFNWIFLRCLAKLRASKNDTIEQLLGRSVHNKIQLSLTMSQQISLLRLKTARSELFWPSPTDKLITSVNTWSDSPQNVYGPFRCGLLFGWESNLLLFRGIDENLDRNRRKKLCGKEIWQISLINAER